MELFYDVSNEVGYRVGSSFSDFFHPTIPLQPDLTYALALCHYRKKEYDRCLKFIADIIDNGSKAHPGS